MRVLVTGAAGRIGRMLVRKLQQAGHVVRGFDIAEPPPDYEPDEMVVGSLLNPMDVELAMDGMEAVAHLAALMGWAAKDHERMFDLNVRATFNLLEVAQHKPLTRFLYASTGEVYPEVNPAYLPIDEDHPTQPTSVYGVTKLMGEAMVRTYGRRGLPFTILRFANTQWPHELIDPTGFFARVFHVNAKLAQLRSLPPSPPVDTSIAALEAVATDEEQFYIGCAPDGTPYQGCVCDVRDLTSGIVLGLTHPAAAGETFHIGPADSYHYDKVVPYLSQVTGRPHVRVNLATTPVYYKTTIDKARRVLGYEPQYTIFDMIDAAQTGIS